MACVCCFRMRLGHELDFVKSEWDLLTFVWLFRMRLDLELGVVIIRVRLVEVCLSLEDETWPWTWCCHYQGEERAVKQFMFKSWPDYQALPNSVTSLLRMHRLVTDWYKQNGKGPVTIHCMSVQLLKEKKICLLLLVCYVYSVGYNW